MLTVDGVPRPQCDRVHEGTDPVRRGGAVRLDKPTSSGRVASQVLRITVSQGRRRI